MRVRDILLNILIGLGVFAFIAIISSLGTLPFWVGLIFVFIVWGTYVLLVIRDHKRDIKYPLVRLNPRPPIRTPKPRQTTVFDQEEGDVQ